MKNAAGVSMRFGAIALVLTLVLIPWASLSKGNGSDAASHKAKWHAETMTGADARDYSAHYQMENCDVYVDKNERGVRVEATDSEDNGFFLKQVIVITKAHEMDDGYSPAMGEQFFTTGDGTSLPIGKYHDLFYDRCLPNIKLLPDEVKKSFLGFYGIKSDGQKPSGRH